MKTLVIYFSHRGENYMENGIREIKVGNCEIVVSKIKEIMDVDTFQLIEFNPYPFNYTECCNVAKREYQNNERPQAKEFLNDISSYEQIIIVGPIWWGHYPMIFFSQLEKLDFTNKKVKFIVTHEGSMLGYCSNDIKQLCKGAYIYNGLALTGHRVKDCDVELKKYLFE